MVNQPLATNQSLIITIKNEHEGRHVPLPQGAQFQVLSVSHPDALEAEIGHDHAGAPALIVTPKTTDLISDIVVEYSDDIGGDVASQAFDLVAPAQGPHLTLDLTNAQARALPITPIAPAKHIDAEFEEVEPAKPIG